MTGTQRPTKGPTHNTHTHTHTQHTHTHRCKGPTKGPSNDSGSKGTRWERAWRGRGGPHRRARTHTHARTHARTHAQDNDVSDEPERHLERTGEERLDL